MAHFLYISIGAIAGANLRYWVGLWAGERLGASFPYGTLGVNVAGCFLIGLFYGLGANRLDITPELRLLFAVGFLGSFTTFSSFGYESISLLRSGDLWLGLANIAGNNLLGLAAVIVGLALASFLSP
jgi:CrcB protein